MVAASVIWWLREAGGRRGARVSALAIVLWLPERRSTKMARVTDGSSRCCCTMCTCISRDLRTAGPPSGHWESEHMHAHLARSPFRHARATHLDDREALAQRMPALLHDLLVDARLAIVRLDRGRGDLGNLAPTQSADAVFAHEQRLDPPPPPLLPPPAEQC